MRLWPTFQYFFKPTHDCATASLTAALGAVLVTSCAPDASVVSPNTLPAGQGGRGGGQVATAGYGGIGGYGTGGTENSGGSGPVYTGQELWSARFGDDYGQNATGLTVDHDDNFVISGDCTGTLDLGGTPLACGADKSAYLAKFSSSGSYLWGKQFGSGNVSYGRSVAVQSNNQIIMVGQFRGTIDFDPDDGQEAFTTGSVADQFIAGFQSSGEHLWSRKIGDAPILDYPTTVVVDDADMIVLAGSYQGQMDLGSLLGPLVSSGLNDLFIGKLKPDGSHEWSYSYGDSGEQHNNDVATDASYNVAVVGDFTGTLNFGDQEHVHSGTLSGFVAKFAPDGDVLWSRSFSGGKTAVQAVAFDSVGNVIIAGGFSGDVTFGTDDLSNPDEDNIFITKYAADGSYLWTKVFGDSSRQYARSLTTDGADNIIVAGFFRGTVDFGGGALTSAGAVNDDLFSVKLTGDGEHLWSYAFGDAVDQCGQLTYVCGQRMQVDSDNHLIVTGGYNGTIDLGGGALISNGGSTVPEDIFIAKFAP